MSSPSASSTATKPLARLATHATKTCAVQATAYGDCVLKTYTDVRKDICAKEFGAFKECLQTAMNRKW
ncbi:hypothetical protein BD626DRAFT_563613 [Schizophyllum amplum]|uniref:IMS import disulfide relay-system CHCH-CHCH-like Cx9C domain-containing protein n=1 Tax=Schizophyllum amplum TaxID=97359 RepID=A0A550CYM9_9AGAR|nr:hypothetical protein BD626DRAFT_563613 [Auriculariopsis ampla]